MPLSGNHPLVTEALQFTKPWYEPHPGVRRHDQLIARTLTTHIPDAEPELIAAAHIAHSFALAPTEVAPLALLGRRLNPAIAGIVAVMEKENQALDCLHGSSLSLYLRLLISSNPQATQVSAADKIVCLVKLRDPHCAPSTINERVHARLKTYYGFFYYHSAPYLPASLSRELYDLIAAIPARAKSYGEPSNS